MTKPQASVIVQIRDFATMIEDEMSHLLHPSMPGLYTPASRGIKGLPTNVGGPVRRKSDPLLGISSAESSFQIVLQMPDLSELRGYERSKGSVGVCLVKDFINTVIDNNLNWVDVKIPFRNILDEYLLDPSNLEVSIWCEERIRGLLQDLTTSVYEFIGQDTWHIYHTTQVGYDLKIDKVVDFRIHEYTRLKREGII